MTLIHHYHVQIHVQDQTPEWLVKYTGNQIFFERKILLENQEKLHNLQNIHIYVGLQPTISCINFTVIITPIYIQCKREGYILTQDNVDLLS